jgi:hypothetical protein
MLRECPTRAKEELTNSPKNCSFACYLVVSI